MTLSTDNEATPETTGYPIQLGDAEIEYYIPHRRPMRFVDRVEILGPHQFRGEAVWSADSPVLAGHFRGLPVVPGVCLLEAAAQVAGVGALAGNPTARAQAAGKLGMLAGVLKCAFRRPVLAGERVTYEIAARPIDSSFASAKAIATVGTELAATLEFFVCHVELAKLATHVSLDELIRKNQDVFGFDRMTPAFA
jgi:3-hydroxyacyl-[acyl-carrier-protein] dehydratase